MLLHTDRQADRELTVLCNEDSQCVRVKDVF